MFKFRRFKSFIPTCPPPKYDTGCTFCNIPEFPADKAINYEANLNNTTALPWKHLLNLTHRVSNFDNLPSKIEMIPESLNEKLLEYRKLFHSHYPPMISNILLNNHEEILKKFKISEKEQLVYLYPDCKVVKFNIDNTEDFVKHYLVPKDVEPDFVYNPFAKSKVHQTVQDDQKVDLSCFEEFPIEKDLILVCGHTQRDVRCGEIAPMLNRELVSVSEDKQLDIDIGLVSHIGGHAYAGNLIILPKNSSEEIVWYGRVFPDKIQGIIEETVLNKRIIKDLYRGEV